MIDPTVRELGHLALESLLSQKPVEITRHKDEPRDGFPLPIKRTKPAVDGLVTQQYRPIAILEYINDSLSGELAGRNAKARRSQQEQV